MSLLSSIIKLTPVLIITILSCNSQPPIRHDLLQKFYVPPSFEIKKDTKAIVFISDHNCATCNQMFVDFVSKKIDHEHIIFVVSSGMNSIDISPFLNATKRNIIYDDSKQLYNDDKLQTSMIFILNQDQVDTIIRVNAREINNQIDYLNTVL